ncbi:MAG TPA: hypothetical protein VK978_00220 [Candidatus Saccharimonadales bacterium]|nr:hypothetical protein [Candidatus Saccharimonadales bacterium]
MPRPESPQFKLPVPDDADIPFSFNPDATLQLTDAGMELLDEKDRARLEHIKEETGKDPEDVRQHLQSRIDRPNNRVVMSRYDFWDTFGPLYKLGITHLVEREIKPPKPKEPGIGPSVTQGNPATIASYDAESQPIPRMEPSDHIRSDQAAGPPNGSADSRNSFASWRGWRSR